MLQFLVSDASSPIRRPLLQHPKQLQSVGEAMSVYKSCRCYKNFLYKILVCKFLFGLCFA